MDEISYRYHSLHLLDFDIFSKSIGFFYHDKDKIGSIIGFILTIIYVIISISLFIFYTITTINKRDMKVHDSLLFQKEAPEMDINKNLFYFAFGVENFETGYTRFINETIYYPKVEYINKVKEGPYFKIIKSTPLKYERCQEEKFGEDYQHLLVKGELNNSYCLNNLNLTLAGNFKYDKLSYINIGIYPCVNSSDNNNHCQSKEIINKYLSRTFISILAKDIGLEPSNFTYPIIPTFQDLYITIDKSYFTEFCIFFGITEIQTDIGLISDRIKKERYMNYVKTTQGIYNRDEEDSYENGGPICEVQIRMGDDIRIQKRTYMKMSEVFAVTGGYMQLISTLFSFITFLINKINTEIQLVNSIFNFYPRKKRISLKYQLQKNYSTNSPSLRAKNNLQKSQIITSEEKNNTILDMSKNNLILFNNIDQSFKSINQFNPKNVNNSKLNKNNHKNDFIIRDKDSSNDKNDSIKISKINNVNNTNIKKIKSKTTLFEKTGDNKDEIWKKSVNFNSFYYYCVGLFKKDKDDIKLFNFAISFYKQKMDIIYLFHIILLVEKIWGSKNKDFKLDEDININLKCKNNN